MATKPRVAHAMARRPQRRPGIGRVSDEQPCPPGPNDAAGGAHFAQWWQCHPCHHLVCTCAACRCAASCTTACSCKCGRRQHRCAGRRRSGQRPGTFSAWLLLLQCGRRLARCLQRMRCLETVRVHRILCGLHAWRGVAHAFAGRCTWWDSHARRGHSGGALSAGATRVVFMISPKQCENTSCSAARVVDSAAGTLTSCRTTVGEARGAPHAGH